MPFPFYFRGNFFNYEFHRASSFVSARRSAKLPLCFLTRREESSLFRSGLNERRRKRAGRPSSEAKCFSYFSRSLWQRLDGAETDGRFASRFKLGSLDATEIPRGSRHTPYPGLPIRMFAPRRARRRSDLSMDGLSPRDDSSSLLWRAGASLIRSDVLLESLCEDHFGTVGSPLIAVDRSKLCVVCLGPRYLSEIKFSRDQNTRNSSFYDI